MYLSSLLHQPTVCREASFAEPRQVTIREPAIFPLAGLTGHIGHEEASESSVEPESSCPLWWPFELPIEISMWMSTSLFHHH